MAGETYTTSVQNLPRRPGFAVPQPVTPGIPLAHDMRRGLPWTVSFDTTDQRKPAPSIHLKEAIMLWTIAVVLVVLWLLGLMTSYTMGGFVHLLLVLAIVAVLIRVIQGRRAL
jgi:hypothetical protein